jgi:NAD(P)-dependent dehydrogenase (short-subunit alcohol dehydrogenase family)
MVNKNVIITGGSRGIGRDIAMVLSYHGYNVAFTYNTNEDKALQVEKEIIDSGSAAKSFQMNLQNGSNIRETIKEIRSYFSNPIHMLINNAAISQEKPFNEITDADWDIMLKINLRGPFICTQQVLPEMIKNEWGRIINITSIGGQWGGYNQVHYAASKSALINFTQSIAKIYSEFGITSNAVAIGLAQTDMSAPELETEDGKNKVSNIPIGRLAKLDEISNTVKFLCSEDASYITGQTINVNGGMFFG